MESEQRREHERQRKADWRAKQSAIREGTYKPTPLETAKTYLEGMDDPEVAAVFQDPELGKVLKPDDRKALTNFVYQLKLKRRKDGEEETKRQEQERLISERGRIFVNQKTYDLQQALLMPMTEEERKKLIKDTIDTNLFLFLEYMEGYQSPSNDFLKIVVGLQD
jgi:hypothetical protein